MRTSPAVPAWFYHVQGKDFWNTDKKNLNDMVQVYKDETQAEYITHEFWSSLDHLLAENALYNAETQPSDSATNNYAEVYKAISMILMTRETLLESRKKAEADLAKAKKAVELNKYLESNCERMLTNIMQACEVNILRRDNYEIKLKLKPGQLKASREANENDFRMLGEHLIRQKFEWNIANIKAGIASGEISHEWAAKEKFELVREQSLSIKRLEADHA